MEKENKELYQELQENVAAQNRADAKTAEIFTFFDEVRVRVLRLWQCYRQSGLTCTALTAAFHRSTPSGRNFLWRICKRGRC
jgi:hypothetical protein